MLEEVAKVIKVQGNQLLIEPVGKSTCQSCQVRSSCGHQSLTKFLARHTSTSLLWIRSPSHRAVLVGDEVLVSIPEGVVIRSTLLVYMLPLILGFVGALLGQWYASPMMGEPGTILGSVIGLALGFLFVFLYSKKSIQLDQWQPKFVRVVRSSNQIPLTLQSL